MAAEIRIKRPKTNESYRALIDQMEKTFQNIRSRAFARFEGRGHLDGFEVDDWLQAERDLFRVPEAEMSETEDEMQIRVAVPGFSRENLEITVLPNLIVVEGNVENEKTEKQNQGHVHFSEFHSQQLLRRFALPVEIDADAVAAVLIDGMLTITARKLKPAVRVANVAVEEEEPVNGAAAAAAV